MATTTILGDVVSHLVGDAASVDVLMPVGADPHDYQPSSQQIARLQRADLVVTNGLGLESSLEDVLESARADGIRVIAVAELVDPIALGANTIDGEAVGLDPHVWLDPVRMADAVRLIGADLSAIARDGPWEQYAEAYETALRAVDTEIREILAAVPDDRRKLVTNHESFGYFARRYGFEQAGVIVPGGSTLSNPSSANLAKLVEIIKRERIPAIFAETTEPRELADAVAGEVGPEVVVVELYAGSLGEPGSEADTLIGMLRTNAELIADALS
ncbi:MAG: metal ABC transporter substrate-binding protein [Acidimicrobiia bacterium]|nr:metal ABC transporter substrate-binding protein [Acidimicrobiia bacterium]